MKKVILTLSLIAAFGAVALISPACSNSTNSTAKASSDTTIAAGSIVYFDLDKVIEGYDMANDLSSVFETKVNSINEEVNRRGTKIENDQRAFQDKINKGLLTQTVAETQYQKLLSQQNDFQNYANQKQQEIGEEQAVMMNQIADAIKTFVDEYNKEKGYAMILATQGAILPSPVVTGDEKLDITEDIIAGLNAKYVSEKGKSE